jgi:hypothetical protein
MYTCQSNDKGQSLKNLYTTLETHLSQSTQDSPTLVLIDNLSNIILGLDSLSPELDLIEIFNSLESLATD